MYRMMWDDDPSSHANLFLVSESAGLKWSEFKPDLDILFWKIFRFLNSAPKNSPKCHVMCIFYFSW